MAKTSALTSSHVAPRKIIGISLSPELAEEVKAEAVRRKLRVKALFVEMWALYKRSHPKS